MSFDIEAISTTSLLSKLALVIGSVVFVGESEPEDGKGVEFSEMGGGGIKDDISAKRIETAAPLSNRIWYMGDPKESKDRGMSITVPARSM